MAKRDKRILGKLELMIMQVVWNKGEATVHQVRNTIQHKRDLAYSTILTMMRKLEHKGLLAHRTENRTYIYRPLVRRDEVERSMLQDLLQNVFGGSHRQFVNAFVEHENISKKDLIQLVHEAEDSTRNTDDR